MKIGRYDNVVERMPNDVDVEPFYGDKFVYIFRNGTSYYQSLSLGTGYEPMVLTQFSQWEELEYLEVWSDGECVHTMTRQEYYRAVALHLRWKTNQHDIGNLEIVDPPTFY